MDAATAIVYMYGNDMTALHIDGRSTERNYLDRSVEFVRVVSLTRPQLSKVLVSRAECKDPGHVASSARACGAGSGSSDHTTSTRGVQDETHEVVRAMDADAAFGRNGGVADSDRLRGEVDHS